MNMLWIMFLSVMITTGTNAAQNCTLIRPLPKDSPLQKKITRLAHPPHELYEVDANNDGKKELVIANQGPGLSLASIDLDDPNPTPKPLDFNQETVWGTHAYLGNGPAELFVKCGDTVALSFQGAYPGERALFVWTGDEFHRACNGDWINFYLEEAKKFSDQKKWFFAENDLGSFYKKCENQFTLPEKTRVQKQLHAMEAALGETKPDPKALEQARTPFYDLDQLISMSVPSLHALEFKRTEEEWIDYTPMLGAQGKRYFSFSLKDYVRDALHDKRLDKTMLTPRIAQFEGCLSDPCHDTVLLWVDSEKHQSLFAIARFDLTPLHGNRNCLLIGSRISTPTSVPDSFWSALKSFRKKAKTPESTPVCMIYEKKGRSIFTVLDRATSDKARDVPAHGP